MACRRAAGPAASRCDAIRAAELGSCLQRPTHREVQLRRGRPAQAEQNCFAVEIMGEPRLEVSADDHAGPSGLVQQVQRLGFVGDRTDQSQQVQVDVPTDDRGPVQEPHAPGGQASKAAAQRLGHGPRDVGLVGKGALRGQQPGQLTDEERVAATPPPQQRTQLSGRCFAGEYRCHRRNLRLSEAVKDEVLRVGGQGEEFRRRLGVAVGAGQQHPAPGQRAGQESQHSDRGLVGPLQVVKDHQERAARRRGPRERRRRIRIPGTARPRQRRHPSP